MQVLLSHLFEVFKQELEKYRQLLEILYQERQVLVDRRIPELSDLVRQEERVIHHIEQIEYARDDLLTQLLSYSEFDAKPLNASTLVDLTEEPLRSEYTRLFEEVKQIKVEFEHVNDTNKQLLQNERDYIHFIMEQITRIDEPGDTYAGDGSLRKPAVRGFFDRRI